MPDFVRVFGVIAVILTVVALELWRRFVSLAPEEEERLTVNSPEDVANLVAGEMGALD